MIFMLYDDPQFLLGDETGINVFEYLSHQG